MYGHNCSKNSQWLEHTNDRVGVMFIKGFVFNVCTTYAYDIKEFIAVVIKYFKHLIIP